MIPFDYDGDTSISLRNFSISRFPLGFRQKVLKHTKMKFTAALATLAAAVKAADPVNVLVCVEAYCPGELSLLLLLVMICNI